MEQKKKFSAFDIVNICILVMGIILVIITFTSGKNTGDDKLAWITSLISNVAAIVAFISAIIYMLCRYTKKAALLFKIYMYAFVTVSAISALFTMTVGSGNMLSSILIVGILLLSVVLAMAKDFGSVKTAIAAGVMFICQLVLCIKSVGHETRIMSLIINFILIAEACIMVLAKYKDKESRGAQ